MTKPAKTRPVSNDDSLKKIITLTSNPPSSIYTPSDDSFLMLDAISRIPLTGKRVLDIGTGSGILALYSATRGGEVTASDIDHEALSHTRKAAAALGVQIKLQVSDLFSNIPERFDLMLFNPPYLPSAEISDRTVDGGANGTTLIDRFLIELPAHLNKKAEALLLLSSLNNPSSVRSRHRNLEFTTVARKALFFECLQVSRLRFRDDLTI